ncbi:MAG: DUF937 domain-containing protein [Hyphomicrobiaceae bacterium]
MKIYDLIASAQGGEAIANLARTAGITEAEAAAVVEAALPSLVSGIERNTLSRGGLADLVKALGAGHHEVILERPDVYGDPRVQQDGQGILSHILGSDSKARGLALQTARATGLSDSIIQMLLPILAQMLMGALSRWFKGGLGDIAGRLPGGVQLPQGGGGGLPFPMPQPGGAPRDGGYGRGFELPKAELPQGGYPMPPLPGGGGDTGFGRGGTMEQAPMPRGAPQGGFPMPWPTGRDPNVGDAPDGGLGGNWPQQGGGPQSGSPLPLPLPQAGGNNPYGDLSDILRRGGGSVGTPRGGGVGGSIRDLLGGALGFQGKGVLSWIIRAVIMRFGWSLLKRVLGRALTGR